MGLRGRRGRPTSTASLRGEKKGRDFNVKEKKLKKLWHLKTNAKAKRENHPAGPLRSPDR